MKLFFGFFQGKKWFSRNTSTKFSFTLLMFQLQTKALFISTYGYISVANRQQIAKIIFHTTWSLSDEIDLCFNAEKIGAVKPLKFYLRSSVLKFLRCWRITADHLYFKISHMIYLCLKVIILSSKKQQTFNIEYIGSVGRIG